MGDTNICMTYTNCELRKRVGRCEGCTVRDSNSVNWFIRGINVAIIDDINSKVKDKGYIRVDGVENQKVIGAIIEGANSSKVLSNKLNDIKKVRGIDISSSLEGRVTRAINNIEGVKLNEVNRIRKQFYRLMEGKLIFNPYGNLQSVEIIKGTNERFKGFIGVKGKTIGVKHVLENLKGEGNFLTPVCQIIIDMNKSNLLVDAEEVGEQFYVNEIKPTSQLGGKQVIKTTREGLIKPVEFRCKGVKLVYDNLYIYEYIQEENKKDLVVVGMWKENSLVSSQRLTSIMNSDKGKSIKHMNKLIKKYRNGMAPYWLVDKVIAEVK